MRVFAQHNCDAVEDVCRLEDRNSLVEVEIDDRTLQFIFQLLCYGVHLNDGLLYLVVDDDGVVDVTEHFAEVDVVLTGETHDLVHRAHTRINIILRFFGDNGLLLLFLFLLTLLLQLFFLLTTQFLQFFLLTFCFSQRVTFCLAQTTKLFVVVTFCFLLACVDLYGELDTGSPGVE